jgi:hypothetical protein
MKPIYRVVKHTRYEKCDVKREYFTIQKQVKFLMWTFWRDITETNCGMGDCGKCPITFKTESDAIFAIKKLEMGNIADGWTENVTKVLDFNRKG